ncbi:MAG: hypothetical protein A2571_01215 [Candidatus Vogelbacteria bacterium RIFOXYD1_FULL_44_32]|uniref:HTH deoR-type domain-containing protein n=1 Tax=Candidatus Vogelbacteria bacterium RIFOXYD1_FULL_44_32 TaxID=1802438 RepID=A0A1G2QFZ8_9BACT|nr:MAG: hypothetical protein A2571_01215 [Candidatus Vogelbacteria bacterium RIFOXYD1_FULL_44_32]
MITKDKNVAVVNFSPEQASFIVTKNQRLASAVYMVTNLMPETEPLKWKLRELSLGLLAEINLSFSSAVSPVNFLPDKSFKILGDILSYIYVALSDSNISQMNFMILKQEYESLKNTITAGATTANFSSYLLAGGEPPAPTTSTISLPTPEVFYQQSKVDRPMTSSPTPLSRPVGGLPKVNFGAGDLGDKGGRKDKIKEFLKGREWTSIKDISRAIPGCSVKTIQRDLVDLVSAGLLLKTGERRWSRYRLIA